MGRNTGTMFAIGHAIGRSIRRADFDTVLCALDVVGMVPWLNIPAEVFSGLISLAQRDYVGCGLSVAGIVPFEGEWAVALKLARTALKLARTA